MKPILLSLGLTALLASLALAQAPAGKLVGYWPFEEASGMVLNDASGGSAAGQIANDGRGVKRVLGRNGGALEFDGGDPTGRNVAGAVGLSGLDAVDWSKGLTVEAWVKFSQLDRPATYELVANSVDDRGPGFRFNVSWQSLWLRSGEGGAGKTWGAASNPSNTRLEPGQWYHLAATYDGSLYRVYVDGLLAGQSEPGLTLPPGEKTIWLGSYHGGYAYGFNGVMDDVRLYDYARTPAEVIHDARLGN